MARDIRICKDCGTTYEVRQDKPGLITQCGDCGQAEEDLKDIERLGGNMIWEGKQAPYIEIKPIREAEDFADKTRRLGAGVTASIVQPKKRSEKEMFGQGQWMSDEPLRD